MDRRYKHLTSEERGVILAEHRRGASLRAIGLLLGRSVSTIGRELRRGRPEGEPALPYCAQRGGAGYRARRKRCGRRHKLVAGGWLHDFVRVKLVHRRWSPAQIACKLRVQPMPMVARTSGAAIGKFDIGSKTTGEGIPTIPPAWVSPETIYAAICAQPRGGRFAEMIAARRQHKGARGRSRTTLAGGSIAPESLRIIHRPEEVEGRLVPGHWEGDLIKGAFNRSAVGTVVERKTRYLILSKMRCCTPEAALEGFTRQTARPPAVLRRRVTYDPGREMACHPELARRLKIDICISRSPHALAARLEREHQRSSALRLIPRINRLTLEIRQFFPKGTDLGHNQSDRTERCCAPDEPATPQDPRMENPRRSHGRRTRSLQIKRCT